MLFKHRTWCLSLPWWCILTKETMLVVHADRKSLLRLRLSAREVVHVLVVNLVHTERHLARQTRATRVKLCIYLT